MGRARPMLRGEQLRNTIKRTTNAAGIPLEEPRIDLTEDICTVGMSWSLYQLYVKNYENENEDLKIRRIQYLI